MESGDKYTSKAGSSDGMVCVEVSGMYQARGWLSVTVSAPSSSFQELLRERGSHPAQSYPATLRAEPCPILPHTSVVVPAAPHQRLHV